MERLDMKKGITFQVLTHDRPDMLRNLVNDLLRKELFALERRGEEGQIVVVDDGSTSEEQRKILDELSGFKEIVVLRKDHELQMPESWARNNNRGLQRADCDVVFHFDDDTLIEGPTGWSLAIADTLRARPELGVLCPQRTGIMEPYAPTEHYEGSFGLTEPCFAMRLKTLQEIGPIDESLRWYYGPDLALRIMANDLECGFTRACRQIDLQIRTGEPTDTFPRANGDAFYGKWTRYFDCHEHEWWPYTRHRARVAKAQALGRKLTLEELAVQ